MTRTSKYFLLTLSVALFLFCLSQPAVEFERVCKGLDSSAVTVAGLWSKPIGEIEIHGGLYLFLAGGLGIMFGQLGAVGWIANLLYFPALLMALDPISATARRLAVASLIIAATCLPLTNVAPILADEGGGCFLSAISPGLGYWLWLTSIAALNVAVWFGPFSRNLTAQSQP